MKFLQGKTLFFCNFWWRGTFGWQNVSGRGGGGGIKIFCKGVNDSWRFVLKTQAD